MGQSSNEKRRVIRIRKDCDIQLAIYYPNMRYVRHQL